MIPRTIYMAGIGGIGMSALAQLLAVEGKQVCGADREQSPTTALLEGKGIQIDIGDGEIPEGTELLIYSDAVREAHPLRAAAKERDIPQLSYFEALGEVSRGRKTIAVAGTHGKTTTTGMIAKILSDAGSEPTAVIGSIVRDFESNFLPGGQDLFVVEACEYRDHILKLNPDILVITNIELDHTDYFPNLEALQATFRTAIKKVPDTGAIITDPEHPHIAPLLTGARARIIDYTKKAVGHVQLIGEFNRMNARAALAASLAAQPQLSPEAAVKSISEFKGSWRRFEHRGETPQGALVFDDYAHHPTAVEKTIEAAKEAYPDKKIVVAFHPHTYTRTRAFMQEFARALSIADESVIAPIYAAREPADPSVSNHVLADVVAKYGGVSIALDSFDAIRDRLLALDDRYLIITMGAGDIYKIAEQIAD